MVLLLLLLLLLLPHLSSECHRRKPIPGPTRETASGGHGFVGEARIHFVSGTERRRRALTGRPIPVATPPRA